jgi:putative ABC transport system permease protein
MLSYLKIAFRNIRKNGLYSFINLTGLTLGLGVAITLFWIVRFEYSFDRYHSKADRIYRIRSADKFGELQSHVPQGVIKALKEQLPGVESAASLYAQNEAGIKIGTAIYSQKNIFFAPPAMLEMLDLVWLEGSPAQSLSEPGKAVIDEETAGKLFNGDAMGKTFRYNNEMDLTVSGIIKKVPVNSEFPLAMVISWETLKKAREEFRNENYWGGGDSMNQGFVLLKKGADPEPANKILTDLVKTHKDESTIASYELQPLADMHFDTTKDPFNYSIPAWTIYTLASIGLFLIFIACINYVNLATVQSIQRGREIAMRKVLGSGKTRLIFQFFGETAILVFAALLMGSLLASRLIESSSQLLNTQAGESQVWGAGTIVFLIVLGLVVTFLAGFYPAIVVSGFEPKRALQRAKFIPVGHGVSLRSGLVTLQFVIAQVLVICTLIGIRQIRYFYEKDLGFDKNDIVTVAMPERGSSHFRERFRQELMEYPEIRDVAFGLTTPASKRNHWWSAVSDPNLPGGGETFRIQHIDTNYFDFFRIPLLAGRKLTVVDTTRGPGTSVENTDVMINEKAARDLGYRDLQKALGRRIEVWGMKTTIVGVVKDYNSEDLKSKLIPHVYMYGSWNFQLASIRIDPHKKAAALAHIGEKWKGIFPNNYYKPSFLEDDINGFYENEQKLTNFLKLFAMIGIVIGSLGLFGLVSFVVTQRTKEIGVRKVLGATGASIVSLLSKDFLKLVLVAFAIASPIAWYLMKQFLKEYTFKIDIEPWVFVLAGAVSTGVALVTISVQSIRAAMMNPAESLRGNE